MVWDQIDSIRSRMTDEDVDELTRIYAPTVVANAPSCAYTSLSVQPDGEIRCYGSRATNPEDDTLPREPVYIASTDGGLSWKMHRFNKEALGSYVKSPYSDRCLAQKPGFGSVSSIAVCEHGGGDSTDYYTVPLDTALFAKMPIPLRHAKRWVLAGSYSVPVGERYEYHTAVYLSDNDGSDWRRVELEQADHFKIEPPHLSLRWENPGIEPSVVELDDGTLLMMLRTSTDFHWYSVSHDHGDSWTAPQPTTFHSTLTNPELLRLRDGRIVFFYNNTRPLPEFDKTQCFPPLHPTILDGTWEDVFTNRDSNCVVISEDDGSTWRGFRELMLSAYRNNADFRTVGANACSLDKSVHQFQALELPCGKILVHVGQHEKLSRLVIFDPQWLYEDHREENLRFGLERLSTQVYVRSISGSSNPRPGHCAWNRTNGALLVPDPVGDMSEAILLRNVPDDRLWNGYQGIVWNYPAMRAGELRLRMMVCGAGLRLALLDHWMNPCDDTVPLYAAFDFSVTGDTVDKDFWHELTVRFDTDRQTAVLLADGRECAAVPLKAAVPHGVCYLHLQTLTGAGDSVGSLVKDFSVRAIPGDK